MPLPPLPRVLVPHPHVRVDDSVLQGSPHVAGFKVPVRRLWAWHRSGVAIETLFRRYPQLSPGQILDALSFAYDNVDLIHADLEREQKLLDDRKPEPPGRPPNQLALFADARTSAPPPRGRRK